MPHEATDKAEATARENAAKKICQQRTKGALVEAAGALDEAAGTKQQDNGSRYQTTASIRTPVQEVRDAIVI